MIAVLVGLVGLVGLPVADTGSVELGVLVPSMLGAGILVSLVLGLLDLLSLVRGKSGRDRAIQARAVLLARSVTRMGAADGSGGSADRPADGSADGSVDARAGGTTSGSLGRRLPPRWVAGLVGLAATILGVYAIGGAFFNYWDLSIGTSWSDQIAWLWALLTLGGLAMVVLGIGALAIALMGRSAPAWTAFVVLYTPLGRPRRR